MVITKLKNMRQRAGMTQGQLAKEAGINLRTLQHYEIGSISFDHARIDKIFKVCIVLNCRFEDIIEDESYIELYNKMPR